MENKNYIYHKINNINRLKMREEKIKKNLHKYSGEDLFSIMNELADIENEISKEVNEYLKFSNDYSDLK